MKGRVIVLVFANAAGPDNFPLRFIGYSLKPCTFTKKKENFYGLDYPANQKAWMTNVLFLDWLKRFHVDFQRQQRYILLLIDNFSAQYGPGTLSELSIVSVVLFPLNTISKLQLWDAEITVSLKVRFRSYQPDWGNSPHGRNVL